MGLSSLPTIRKSNSFFAVGLGINFRLQITPEARETISRASTIFALTPDVSAVDFLQLENEHAHVIDCSTFYQGKQTRPEAYEAIVRHVLVHLESGDDVALVTYGHPLFLVSAVEHAIEQAKRAGYNCTVIPGITSLDTLQADLQIDLGYGAIIADATLVLNGGITLSNKIPTVIFQIANIGSAQIESASISLERIGPLVDLLLSVYPPSHQCALVVSRKSLFDPPEVEWMSVSDLRHQTILNLSARPTLYLPEMVG